MSSSKGMIFVPKDFILYEQVAFSPSSRQPWNKRHECPIWFSRRTHTEIWKKLYTYF